MGLVKDDVAIDREQKAWEMRTQKFYTIYQIATVLGVTPQAVSLMLKRVGVKIAKEMAGTVESQKAEQSHQLDLIISQSLDAWERSKEDAERTVERVKQLGMNAGKEQKKPKNNSEEDEDYTDPEDIPNLYMTTDGFETTAEERARMIAQAAAIRAEAGIPLTVVEKNTQIDTKGQIGDPRYLAEAQKALDAKRSLWGLDAPKKVHTELDFKNMSDAELNRLAGR